MSMEMTVQLRKILSVRDYFARKREGIRRREIEACFDGAVHNCCKVSSNNHQLAFVIHRSVKGYPRVESLRRPDIVQLSERDDCVIVKDGYVYELRRETR